ncbi:MAG TPA: hypothetical protein VHV32_06870 [Candidatus Angelobacter sp.]|nr:hypothetical protein [Candidatus Angelobacter sp.]
MRFAKVVMVAVLGFAFAAYGFDCSPMMSPNKAMECCDSMNCSHGMHGEDCCRTAPSMHAPFVQPASIHIVTFASLAFAVEPAPVHFSFFDCAHVRAVLRFHDPPPTFDSTAPLQLRI